MDDSKAYNHALARTAMALSGASYVEDDQKIPQNDSIVKALEDFGFDKDTIKSYKYKNVDGYLPTENDNDHVGYTFATKRVEYERGNYMNVVAIVIKGTSGDAEWYSNFAIGWGDSHYGFTMAKEELMKDFCRYLEDNNLNNSTTKFLVTGHSRGAAVANMVAAELTDFNNGYGQANVYGYTFAAPAVSTRATERGYENIFNIINSEDFVPRVPLKKWDYKRYGVDLLLPSRSFCNIMYNSNPLISEISYNTIFKRMQDQYEYLTGEEYESYGGTQRVDNLVETVFDLSPTIDDYFTTSHLGATTFQYFYLMAGTLAENTVGKIVDTTGLLSMVAYTPITGFFVVNHILSSRVFSAHSMAGYYSWLTTGTAPEILYCAPLNSSTKVTYKRVEVKCPVDVYVFDENGILVASVVDEKVIENVLAISVENSEKTIDLPSDQEYSIKIVATGGGSVSYTVEELSAEGTGNSVLRTVIFNGISITEGDELTGNVNDILYTDKENYALTKNTTDKIYADYDSSRPRKNSCKRQTMTV